MRYSRRSALSRDKLVGSLIVIYKNQQEDEADVEEEDLHKNTTTGTTSTTKTAHTTTTTRCDEEDDDSSSSSMGINRYEQQECFKEHHDHRGPSSSRWLHPAFRRMCHSRRGVASSLPQRPPPRHSVETTSAIPTIRVGDCVEVRHGKYRGAKGRVLDVSLHLVQVCLDQRQWHPNIAAGVSSPEQSSSACYFYTPERLHVITTTAVPTPANHPQPNTTIAGNTMMSQQNEATTVKTKTSNSSSDNATELKDRVQQLLQELTDDNLPPLRSIAFVEQQKQPQPQQLQQQDKERSKNHAIVYGKEDTDEEDWCKQGGSQTTKTAGTTTNEDENISVTTKHHRQPQHPSPTTSRFVATGDDDDDSPDDRYSSFMDYYDPIMHPKDCPPIIAMLINDSSPLQPVPIINLVDSSEFHSELMLSSCSPNMSRHHDPETTSTSTTNPNRDGIFRNLSPCRLPIASHLNTTGSTTPPQRALRIGDLVDISAGIYKGKSGRVVKIANRNNNSSSGGDGSGSTAGRIGSRSSKSSSSSVLAHVKIFSNDDESMSKQKSKYHNIYHTTMMMPPQLLSGDILMLRPDPPIGLNVLWSCSGAGGGAVTTVR